MRYSSPCYHPPKTGPRRATATAESPDYQWSPVFTQDTFTQLPHVCFLLVLEKRLLPSDLITYAYFLGRACAMEEGTGKPYTIVPESQVAADLKCCVRTVRYSVNRLVKAGLIERQDTPRNARTRMLALVVDGVVVRRAAEFPQKERPTTPDYEPLPANVTASSEDESGNEMPWL